MKSVCCGEERIRNKETWKGGLKVEEEEVDSYRIETFHIGFNPGGSVQDAAAAKSS